MRAHLDQAGRAGSAGNRWTGLLTAAMTLLASRAVASEGGLTTDEVERAIELDVTQLRSCTLPRGLPIDALSGDPYALARALMDLREANPALFGPTDGPLPGSRLVPDAAPMDELLVVYPGWEELDATYATLLAHASRHGNVRVLMMDGAMADTLAVVLESSGADRSRVRVQMSPVTTSIWVRDWGPQPMSSPLGESWVDARYSPDCYDNDALASRLQPRVSPVHVVRTDLYVDGGDLLVDPTGQCYSTTTLIDVNDLPADVLRERLKQEMACTDVVFLEPLQGNVIGHVDMLLSVTPRGDLLLAGFDPAEDPANAAVMRRNRAVLERMVRADGTYPTLTDVPSPSPGWSVDGPVVRTWVNALPFNGVVFVPGYADAQPERQAAAMSVFREAFPSHDVVLIESDPLIRLDGGVHCMARGIRSASSAPLESVVP